MVWVPNCLWIRATLRVVWVANRLWIRATKGSPKTATFKPSPCALCNNHGHKMNKCPKFRDYLTNFLDNLVNWENVASRL